MDWVIVTVRDTKLNSFMQPFFSPSIGGATRAFTDAVRDPQHPMSKHPEDYELFRIGIFDDQEGKLIPEPQPHFIVNALSVKGE